MKPFFWMGSLDILLTLFKKKKKRQNDQDLIPFQFVLFKIVSSFVLDQVSGIFFFQENF